MTLNVRGPEMIGLAFRGYEPNGVWPFVRDINVDTLTAQKITTGELTAELTITSGSITVKRDDDTAALSLDDDGLNIYMEAAAPFEETSRVDWWRSGDSDTYPSVMAFGRLETLAGTAGGIVVRDFEAFGTETPRLYLVAHDNTEVFDTPILGDGALAALYLTREEASLTVKSYTDRQDRERLRFENGVTLEADVTDGGGALTLHRPDEASGRGVTLDGALGGVEIAGPGLFIGNAGVVSSGSVTAGTTVTQSVTYATEFPSTAAIPAVLCSPQDSATSERWTVTAINRTRTGCDLRITNESGSTGSTDVVFVPIVT